MRRFVLSVVLLLAVGCSRPAEVEAPSSLATFYTGTPQVFAARQPGWKIGVLEPRDEGRDFSPVGGFEFAAVDRWIVVPVVFQNSSDRRQSSDFVYDVIVSAGLVGSDDQLYEVHDSYQDYSIDTTQPLEPGKTYQFLLLFDVPEGVEPKQLLTDTSDTFNSLQIDL